MRINSDIAEDIVAAKRPGGYRGYFYEVAAISGGNYRRAINCRSRFTHSGSIISTRPLLIGSCYSLRPSAEGCGLGRADLRKD